MTKIHIITNYDCEGVRIVTINDRLKTQRLILSAIGLLSIVLLGVAYFGDFNLWAVVVAWLSHR